MNKEEIVYEIVYAADDNFSAIMGVSIFSLLENNKNKFINITVLDSGIKISNKEKICATVEFYKNAKVRFIESKNIEKMLGVKLSTDRGSLSQFARLFISSLFEKYNGKILYLDCDTIILNSLDDLMQLEIGDNIIAALKDAFSTWYRKNIGLQKNDIMFNSGVMLIDLNRWREENIENKIIDFIKKNDGKIQQGDQGVLNAILSKKTYIFEPKYNLISIFFDLSYRELMMYRNPINFYNEEEIRISKKNAVILHYTSSFYAARPWDNRCKHIRKECWLNYKKMSLWGNDEIYSTSSKNIKKSIIMKIPKKIILPVASLFQQFLRPLYFRYKN